MIITRKKNEKEKQSEGTKSSNKIHFSKQHYIDIVIVIQRNGSTAYT